MENILNGILVGVPESTANMQLPDPDLRDYYRDEEDRIFWLDRGVEECATDLSKMIIRCNREDKGKPTEDRKPIKIFIDSPGGDVTFMWSVIKTMEMSKTKVITINYCTAYSAAAEILASGHERYAFPGSHVMIHLGSCAYAGDVANVETTKKYFDALSKKTVDHLLARTKIEPKMFKKKTMTDWFLDEDDALKNGVVDKIISDLDEIF
jgi:ATP-dependent Clp protease protease subunit